MSQSVLELVRHRPGRVTRIVTLLLVAGPPFGVAMAIALLWRRGVSPLDVSLFLTFYVLSGLGITVGFHRLFTHQSFQAPRFVRATLALMGSLALQGDVLAWVSDHRRHHAFADKPGDPHSPHIAEEDGFVGVIKGFWHAHTGWLFTEAGSLPERWAPDMARDRDMVRISKLFPVLILVSFGLPALIGLLVTGSWFGAFTGALWGGVVRVFLLHHVTWSINSVCHLWGTRPYKTKDFSTNNRWLSIISFGESWHNTHHAFPTSAVHGLKRSELDVTGLVIKAMAKVRLARDVKVPSPKELEAKTN